MTGPRDEQRLLVVTGLSGSGKSYAARALEDIGWNTIDNLPLALLRGFVEEAARGKSGPGRNAVVLDVRNPGFAEAFPPLLDALRPLLPVTVVFLEADEPTIFRRFSETRRPHPLSLDRTLADAMAMERQLLAEVKGKADLVLDTTAMTVHELRSVLAEHFRSPGDPGVLAVSILSFGFKHGVPPSIDLCFDVRFLANPHFVPELRYRTGRDPNVARFIEEGSATGPFYGRLLDFLLFCLPNYRRENRAYLTIGVGCTGGRHRSVYVAERLGRDLAAAGYPVRVSHRDDNREGP
ncbi:MAG: RNase adapter RapZ [Thermoanaerobaculia bacterium]